jgi:hypothetical protein
MGKRVSETRLCWYQIVQIDRGTCKRPRIQPIGCPGEHDGHGQRTPLAIGPVTLVAILMLVCVVGIGKRKV